MMGTAVPIMDPDSDVEYSPRRQGSGLGNVENAVNSPAYVTIDGNDDGKVKVEFGDDPARTGTYSFVPCQQPDGQVRLLQAQRQCACAGNSHG